MQHRRDLYLAVLPEGGHAYAVVTGGDLSRAARFGSRDAAVMHLLRPSDAEPLSGRWIDLGAPGVIAERIVGGPAAAPRARATDRATSHDAALTVRAGSTRARVLSVLRSHFPDGFTLLAATNAYAGYARTVGWRRASESSVRSRVAELVRMGYVEVTEERLRLPSGRYAAVHRVVA